MYLQLPDIDIILLLILILHAALPFIEAWDQHFESTNIPALTLGSDCVWGGCVSH